MNRMTLVLSCLAAVLLGACAAEPTASPIPPTAEPTVDLSATSIEFVAEIKGDPDPLTQVPGMALDGEGNLIVIDGNNHRILRFDSEGRSLGTWGSTGDGDGQFQFHCVESCSTQNPPWSYGGVAVDGEGNVYVADSFNCRIQKFDSKGTFLTKWGESGYGDGQFYAPVGIVVDGESNVYVTDPALNNVQKFDSEGRFLTKWSHLTREGYGPVGPAVDREGNLYVPSDDSAEVHKYSSEGELLMSFGKRGNGDGEFIQPVSVAVDHQGNVYVVDKSTECVQKFNPEGNFLEQWGTKGTGPGEFRGPTALVVDAGGAIYVGEWDGNRIQKFRQQ